MLTTMRCFYILVHGLFDYRMKPVPSELELEGFYAGRHLFARNESQAVDRAFAKVGKGLSKWNADIRDGLVSVHFEAEEVEQTAFWNAFRRSNRGHTFY